MSSHMIKDEKLKEICEQIYQGMSGLYKLWNYVEDSDIDDKELVLEGIEKASTECFIVQGFIHVINESWKLPGSGHVPLEGK